MSTSKPTDKQDKSSEQRWSVPSCPAHDWQFSVAGWLTVERALWITLLLVAATMRFLALGEIPLSSPEAHNALSSWQIIRGLGGSVEAAPLLIYGNALLFFAFGASDAIARLLPAVAGFALVGMPYLLRDSLGRGGALVSGLFLAISPTLLYFGRFADAQALVAAAGLSLVVCLVSLRDALDRRALFVAAAVLGLLILAGRDAFTMLFVLASASMLGRRHFRFPDKRLLSGPALLAAAVVVLGATAFLMNLHGLQEALVSPLGDWLSLVRGGSQPWYSPLLVLLVYEPAPLLFGALGALAARRRRDPLARFLAFWAVVAIVFAVLSGQRPSAGLALVVVPLVLLAGPLILSTLAAVWRSVPRAELAVFLGVMLSLLTLNWIGLQFFTVVGQSLPAIVPIGPFHVPSRGLDGLVSFGQVTVLFAALIGLGLWIGAPRLPGMLALLALVVLIPFALHSAVLLNYVPYASAAELPVASRTASDVRSLANDLSDTLYALALSGRPRAARVVLPAGQSREVGPFTLLRWYLRNELTVAYDGELNGDEAVILLSAGAEPPVGQFAAERYRLQSTWTIDADGAARFWRWLSLRELPSALRNEEVILYVRAP